MIFGGQYKFRPSVTLCILLGLLIFMPSVFLYISGFIIALIFVPLGFLWFKGLRWMRQAQSHGSGSTAYQKQQSTRQQKNTTSQSNKQSTVIDCDDYHVIDESKPNNKD